MLNGYWLAKIPENAIVNTKTLDLIKAKQIFKIMLNNIAKTLIESIRKVIFLSILTQMNMIATNTCHGTFITNINVIGKN